MAGKPKIDIMGVPFGLLTPIRPTAERKLRSTVWVCDCECGRRVRFPRVLLVGRKKTDCGCVKAAEKARMEAARREKREAEEVVLDALRESAAAVLAARRRKAEERVARLREQARRSAEARAARLREKAVRLQEKAQKAIESATTPANPANTRPRDCACCGTRFLAVRWNEFHCSPECREKKPL